MTKRSLIIMILLGVMLFSSCNAVKTTGSADKPAQSTDFMMGTFVEQKVFGDNSQKAVDRARSRLKQLEAMMTINAGGGEINKLNSQAGKSPVKVSEDCINVLEASKKYAQISSGAFDITVGPLAKAWGVFTSHPDIPDRNVVDRLLALVDINSLVIDRVKTTAFLKIKGQAVDLGGIAKGYAADEALKIYKSLGIKSGYINLGGNVALLGSKPDGTMWRIGIQNPRAERGIYLGTLSVRNKTVVTSGDYERYFIRENVRYHHILDPKTGFPSRSGLISTTIVTDVSMDADALSTSVFVLGLEKGLKLVESLQGVDAILVTEDKKVYMTSGLKKSFVFQDPSREFTLAESGAGLSKTQAGE